MRIDLELLAGKDHGRGAELFDHGRSVEPDAGGERPPLVDRRLSEGTGEKHRPAVALRRHGRADVELGNARAVDHSETGHSEIDQLHFLLAGVVVAEGLEMGGVERSDETLDERTADRARGRGDAYLHGLAGI